MRLHCGQLYRVCIQVIHKCGSLLSAPIDHFADSESAVLSICWLKLNPLLCEIISAMPPFCLWSFIPVAVVFRAVRRNISGRECLYADGGILDQYPISFFDGKLAYIMT